MALVADADAMLNCSECDALDCDVVVAETREGPRKFSRDGWTETRVHFYRDFSVTAVGIAHRVRCSWDGQAVTSVNLTHLTSTGLNRPIMSSSTTSAASSII